MEILETGYWILDTGYWILDLDPGYWTLDLDPGSGPWRPVYGTLETGIWDPEAICWALAIPNPRLGTTPPPLPGYTPPPHPPTVRLLETCRRADLNA